MVYVAAPLTEFATFRGDMTGHYLKTLDDCGDLGDRVRAGERAERFRTTPDLPPDAALADYQRRRDAALGPMFDFTTDLAAFRPPRLADRQLPASLHGRPAEIDRFLGVFAGVTPIRQYRSPRNLLRLLGVRGLARIGAAALGQMPRKTLRFSRAAAGRAPAR
jgi:hypothetical protein